MLQTTQLASHRVDPTCNWSDLRGASVIVRWMQTLRNMLAFVSYFLARTSSLQQSALAAVIWRELHRSFKEHLQQDNHLMRSFAEEHHMTSYGVEDHTRASSPEPPGETPTECVICMDARPSVVLIPCGHLFCNPCIEGLGRCPACRSLFQAKYNVYF